VSRITKVKAVRRKARKTACVVFPCIGTQRPAVSENNRLACSPILVIDGHPVFSCNRPMKNLLSCFGIPQIPPLSFARPDLEMSR
jgi:hypothetical protein